MHYVGRRRSETDPLASIPLVRPASILRLDWVPTPPTPVLLGPCPYPPLAPQVLRERELANAHARLHEAERLVVAARAGIGDANRTHTAPVMDGGRVVYPALRFSAERRRQRRSQAFRMLNQRRRELGAARRRVDAARAALEMPSLALVEERAEVATELRASKRAHLDCREQPAAAPLA